MHRLSTSFVLGYHGCDQDVAERLIGGEPFQVSANDYDWLGGGVYFWEANPRRGLEFAREVQRRLGRESPTRRPAVVGAVIDLRLCLDLGTSAGVAQVKDAFTIFEQFVAKTGGPMPANRGGKDLLQRYLDRAVLEQLHEIRATQDLSPIDTVRGFFFEGEPTYPGAGFFEKTHIQICVRNLDCIRGVFRVPELDLTEG